MRELVKFRDGTDGEAVVMQVFDGSALNPANQNDDAPDLVVGYAPGFRASWQTTLGGAPRTLVDDNARKWSGDHCIAPDAVPGVLFSSFDLDDSVKSIGDIAHSVRTHWREQ
jgi:hypothetical protein